MVMRKLSKQSINRIRVETDFSTTNKSFQIITQKQSSNPLRIATYRLKELSHVKVFHQIS